MRQPLQITFHGLEKSDALEDAISSTRPVTLPTALTMSTSLSSGTRIVLVAPAALLSGIATGVSVLP